MMLRELLKIYVQALSKADILGTVKLDRTHALFDVTPAAA
jgi:hypothetical protein